MATRNLIVRAVADFSSISRQAKKASSGMRGMQQSVAASCRGIKTAISGIKSALGALGVGLSLAAVVSAAKSAKDAYAASEESAVRLAQVMRNVAGASDAEIASIQELMGAQQRLGVVEGGVQAAGAQELATYTTMTSSLRTLIPVMNDMAAQQYGFSASAEHATNIATMLGKVLQGQTGALSRYGYYFTEAQAAILKTGTEEERVATLAAVVEANVGGVNAALAATPTGRMQQLSNTLGDIKERFGAAVTTIGTALLPVLNRVAAVLADVATLAGRVAQAIANVFGGKAEARTVAYSGAVAGAAANTEDYAEATQSAGKAAKSLATASIDTLHVLKAGGGSSGGGSSGGSTAGAGSSGIRETAGAAQEAAESCGWLEERLQGLKDLLGEIDLAPIRENFGKLKDAVEPLSKALEEGLGLVWENILKPLGEWTISEALPAVIDVLAGALDFLGAIIEVVKPLLSWLWEKFLKPLASFVGDAVVYALQGLAEILEILAEWIRGIPEALERLKEKAVDAYQKVKRAWENAPELFAALKEEIGQRFSELWAHVSERASNAWGCVCSVWQGGVSWFRETFATPVRTLLSNAFEDVRGAASNAWNSVRGAWSTAAGWFAGNVSEPIRSRLQASWRDISQAASTMWSRIRESSASSWGDVTGRWKAAGAWFSSSIAQPLQERLGGAWVSARNTATAAWGSIRGVWSTAVAWMNTSFVQPIKNVFRTASNAVIGFFEGITNLGVRAINALISSLNRISVTVPSWVPLVGGKRIGFSIPTLPQVSLPRLARGAVIPPRREFAAILGDQRSGTNIETPEQLLRQIYREENLSPAVLALLRDILDAVREGKVLTVDKRRLARVVGQELAQQARATGGAVLGVT